MNQMSSYKRKERKKEKSFGSKLVMFAMFIMTLILVAAMIYTYFVKSQNKGNNIVAGTLDCSIQWTGMSGYKTNEYGESVKFKDETVVELEKFEGNIFNIDRFTPTQYQEASFRVTNTGNIAFRYTVSVMDVVAEGANSLAMKDQIKITVLKEGQELGSFMLNEALEMGSMFEVDKVVTGENGYQDFVVRAEFIDHENNNAAEGGVVSFDLRFVAIQAIN